ncbi:MAG: hypothetical protein WCS49_02490 [Bacilli bacterium]
MLHWKHSQIYQYSLDGHFIASYHTCKEASKVVYIYYRCIEKACRGVIKTAGDFQWKRVPFDYQKNDINPLKK